MKIFDFKVRILASLIKKRAPFNADYFVGGQKKPRLSMKIGKRNRPYN